MTSSVMSLESQLVELSRMADSAMPNNPPVPVRWHPNSGLLRVDTLAHRLRQVGIEPADAAKYDELSTVEWPEPTSPEGRRLDLSRDEYQRWIFEWGVYINGWEKANRRLSEEHVRLHAELQESMRSEAEDYVDQLRPAFHTALSEFRHALSLGITVTSTAETVMYRGQEVIDAWRAIHVGRAGRVLLAVTGLRVQISLALGVPPKLWLDWAPDASFGDCLGVGQVFDQHQGVRRWLAVAAVPTAHLVTTRSI